LPPEVHRLVAQLASRHHLVVLLLLREHADQGWTPAQIGAAVGLGAEAANRVAGELAAIGALRATRGTPASYAYGPATAPLRRSIDDLAEAYAGYPTGIVRLLGPARPPNPSCAGPVR
jgi:hypothetical protein